MWMTASLSVSKAEDGLKHDDEHRYAMSVGLSVSKAEDGLKPRLDACRSGRLDLSQRIESRRRIETEIVTGRLRTGNYVSAYRKPKTD